jgi:DNA-directed RNA polymerase specialized sigma24 family protein
MSNYVIIQNPSDLSARFSNRDRLGWDGQELDVDELIEQNLAPEEEEEIDGTCLPDFSLIERYLDRIPDREADLITLYYRDRMKQEQIAKLFRITQAAVSYRLHRGIRRIQFLRTIPELMRDQFELELGPKFSDQDREILWRMYETTCQSEIAKQMNLTQGRVRHRFFRSLARVKELIREEVREEQVRMQLKHKKTGLDPESDEAKKAISDVANAAIDSSKYAKYWTVFFAISDKHFNILHEVSLPQFLDRGDAQIMTIR